MALAKKNITGIRHKDWINAAPFKYTVLDCMNSEISVMKSICLHGISSGGFYMTVWMCIFYVFVGDPAKCPWLLTLKDRCDLEPSPTQTSTFTSHGNLSAAPLGNPIFPQGPCDHPLCRPLWPPAFACSDFIGYTSCSPTDGSTQPSLADP